MATNLENNLTLQNAIYYNSRVDNKYFNFFKSIYDNDIEGVVEYFKENNITEFTISSEYSNMLGIYMMLQNAGYIMSGMTYIKSEHRDFDTRENLMVPAILFKLQ